MEKQQSDAADDIRELNTQLEALAQQEEDVERLGDLLNEQSYVSGRIAAHLDTLASAHNTSLADTEQRIADLRTAAGEPELGWGSSMRAAMQMALLILGPDAVRKLIRSYHADAASG